MVTTADDIRRFNLVRHQDESGVSGTGVVAVGIVFPDGFAQLQWLNHENNDIRTRRNGLASYPGGIEDLMEIHGHDGATTVEWVSDNGGN